ncbi:hypothetical protein MNEG_5867 [Monoraphidium neglectum]|uniref:Uncharacterized protein n=1 Tax=Monoraphidium neglectum TaxID=145388 RepID=A0A0D2MNJ0_9CHLO|nr:hypothetical protein MNEG_5867 [Monoraphidium neglectum]KIZ02092.1 hypothetical protein MNEG_5867 [Monoraphidium neglectum]|eukprot:XP_013901111.1 hypothetical protein MNEG_5867 [Monoraphidium neglectum]
MIPWSGHHRNEEEAYNAVYQGGDGGPSLGHEALAGAVSFYAMHEFEKRREREGFSDHTKARELLATIAGVEADRLAESRGMGREERDRTVATAQQKATSMYEQHYGGGQQMGGGGGYDASAGYGAGQQAAGFDRGDVGGMGGAGYGAGQGGLDSQGYAGGGGGQLGGDDAGQYGRGGYDAGQLQGGFQGQQDDYQQGGAPYGREGGGY